MSALWGTFGLACGDDPGGTQESGTTSSAPTTTAGSGSGSTSTGSAPASTSGGSSTTANQASGTTTDEGSSTDEGTGEGTTGAVDEDWQAFLDARPDMLEALAVPIVDCVDNVDTSHPAFHGCIDWHSAVHATYSLHVLYRATGDESYRQLADETLEAGALAEELQDVQSFQLPQEVPYGYAWFLALAIERERSTRATDLQPLATEIAEQLSMWIDSRTPNQLLGGGLSDDYGNLSWAVLNLWRWAQWTDDPTLADQMATVVDDVLLDPVFDDNCPLDEDLTDIDDFFPPCLHRAMAIVEIADPVDAEAWMQASLPADYPMQPLTEGDITNAHQGGLNFSRAWGLWSLWNATGDATWRDMFVDHVTTHVEQPQFWAENYQAFSHWVAQFGVYAIAQTYPE